MRILVVSQVWEPESGTPQRRWTWLTRALIAAGHDIDVLAPPPHYPTGHLLDDSPQYQAGSVSPGSNGETIFRTAFREHDASLESRLADQGLEMLSQWRTGRDVIRRRRPDLLVATAPPLPAAFVVSALARTAHLPYVVDLRDAWPDILDNMNDWEPTTDRPARRSHGSAIAQIKATLFHSMTATGGKMLTASLASAAGVISTSSSFAEVLRSRGVARTLTVRNLGAHQSAELAPRPRHSDTLNILYAGTTGRAQELANALRALHDVRERGIDARMRVVGSGAHLKTLRRNAESLGLPVEFTGRIPFADVSAHYEWADTVLIHLQDWPSMSWTVPSKLYEALEMGRHISMSVNGEAADIVNAAHAGDAVPAMDRTALADLWQRLAEDRELLDVDGNGQRWMREHCDPERSAAELVAFLEECARG